MSLHEVRRALEFCYGHRIPGHSGKCRDLHGHNGRVEVVCRGPLDENGMVVDFAEIKRVVGAWIDEHWDHRTLLRRDDPLFDVLKDAGEPVVALECDPTAENMARILFEIAREGGLPVCAVHLWETPASAGSYRAP